MKRATTQVSQGTAIEVLRKFFSKSQLDSMSPEEIILAAGRNPEDVIKNKNWLSNKLSSIRDYGLFDKRYEQTPKGGKKLIEISLTAKGREALGRNRNNAIVNDEVAPDVPQDSKKELISRTLTPESVNADVMALAKMNPSFEVRLIFHPKEQ